MTMKKIEIDTFLKFRFLSNPHFSPDGTKIAFTVSVPDRETNGYLSDLYLYDLGKKTVSRVTCAGDAKIWSWTAENTLIFTAARTAALKKEKENGTSFFYEISPSGGGRRRTGSSKCSCLFEKSRHADAQRLKSGHFFAFAFSSSRSFSLGVTYTVVYTS